VVHTQERNSLHLRPPIQDQVETNPGNISVHTIPSLYRPNSCIFREDGFIGLTVEYQLECNGIPERHPNTIQQLIV